jgi:hypothetical protein
MSSTSSDVDDDVPTSYPSCLKIQYHKKRENSGYSKIFAAGLPCLRDEILSPNNGVTQMAGMTTIYPVIDNDVYSLLGLRDSSHPMYLFIASGNSMQATWDFFLCKVACVDAGCPSYV